MLVHGKEGREDLAFLCLIDLFFLPHPRDLRQYAFGIARCSVEKT